MLADQDRSIGFADVKGNILLTWILILQFKCITISFFKYWYKNEIKIIKLFFKKLFSFANVGLVGTHNKNTKN